MSLRIRRLIEQKDAAEDCALAAEAIVASLTATIGTRQGDPFADVYQRIIRETAAYARECRETAEDIDLQLDQGCWRD